MKESVPLSICVASGRNSATFVADVSAFLLLVPSSSVPVFTSSYLELQLKHELETVCKISPWAAGTWENNRSHCLIFFSSQQSQVITV